MADVDRMREVCDGAHGVFNVQNPMTSGVEGEAVQGRNVVDAAADARVAHLVYGSAGPGAPGTGVAAWDGKLEVAGHARSRGVPLTVLRPMAHGAHDGHGPVPSGQRLASDAEAGR